MIFYKTSDEIELLRESNLLVSLTHVELAKIINEGISTNELDRIAEQFIRDNNAIPGFKGYGGFPNTLCISVNDTVVHGIPSSYVLREGDIVSVDCGVLKNGFYGDSCYTFEIGRITPNKKKLLQITRESLYLGIENAKVGNRIGDISHAVQQHAENNGFSVVRELVGHGIGKKLHESPEVPNYGRKGTGHIIKEGLVIAIEPMINSGKKNVKQSDDGWTIKTADGFDSAHFEHTIAIINGKADILSDFSIIDEIISKRNING